MQNVLDNILTSVHTTTIGDHEIIIWSDNSITIEHWMAPYEPESVKWDYTQLTQEQAKTFVSWLTNPSIF